VANGLVYIGTDDGTVYALNAISGAALWSHGTERWAGLGTSAVVSDGMVYVGGADGVEYAFGL